MLPRLDLGQRQRGQVNPVGLAVLRGVATPQGAILTALLRFDDTESGQQQETQQRRIAPLPCPYLPDLVVGQDAFA